MEERWEELGIMEPVETHLAISPRLGLSFPITERSKFYFNYGHFRGLPPWLNMYRIYHRPQVRVQTLGNPNMEPAKTISYETGVEYNLLNQFLIRIAGYYKDVTGQHGSIRYTGLSGQSNYQSFDNNNYEDIRGVEISVTKNYGEWLTGWANFDYRVERDGNTGRQTYFEDPAKEATQGLYAGQEDRPLPRPRFNANISFHSPMDWGPRAGGIHPLGGWLLSILPSWQKGSFFTWNPLGDLHLENNLRWPDRFLVDIRLAKRTRVMGALAVEAYLNINNLFNHKVNYFSSGYCFQSSSDESDYLRSLHLPMYDSPEFDTLREQFPGMYVAGDDSPGDLRSGDKSYINDPNRALWMFVQPRDIWFGLNFYF
jgi:outer membrane receptor protein involved in Fe transport